jgi:hypothetical protein
MKKKFLVFIALTGAFCLAKSYSQTLSPVVISSSGGFAASSNVMLSYTIGEMAMIQTFTSANNILTQGFQQPEGLFVSVPENPIMSGDLLIYPNPNSGNFTLSFASNCNYESVIKLYDLAGQVVLTKTINTNNERTTINFDISSFRQGIYIMEIPIKNAKGENTREYHKINLIF